MKPAFQTPSRLLLMAKYLSQPHGIIPALTQSGRCVGPVSAAEPGLFQTTDQWSCQAVVETGNLLLSWFPILQRIGRFFAFEVQDVPKNNHDTTASGGFVVPSSWSPMWFVDWSRQKRLRDGALAIR